jgi:chromodomain-helicase-DNA-binding protein 7
VYLLSTRAGGFGINLTAADTVIIFDSDWNPQNDLQAQARCHRLGQKNIVKVYRLISKNTYEAKLAETASRKLGLTHVILEGQTVESSLTAEEIKGMLQFGISKIFTEDDTDCDKFCAQDIDQILEMNAKVIEFNSSSVASITGIVTRCLRSR